MLCFEIHFSDFWQLLQSPPNLIFFSLLLGIVDSAFDWLSDWFLVFFFFCTFGSIPGIAVRYQGAKSKVPQLSLHIPQLQKHNRMCILLLLQQQRSAIWWTNKHHLLQQPVHHLQLGQQHLQQLQFKSHHINNIYNYNTHIHTTHTHKWKILLKLIMDWFLLLTPTSKSIYLSTFFFRRMYSTALDFSAPLRVWRNLFSANGGGLLRWNVPARLVLGRYPGTQPCLSLFLKSEKIPAPPGKGPEYRPFREFRPEYGPRRTWVQALPWFSTWVRAS